VSYQHVVSALENGGGGEKRRKTKRDHQRRKNQWTCCKRGKETSRVRIALGFQRWGKETGDPRITKKKKKEGFERLKGFRRSQKEKGGTGSEIGEKKRDLLTRGYGGARDGVRGKGLQCERKKVGCARR